MSVAEEQAMELQGIPNIDPNAMQQQMMQDPMMQEQMPQNAPMQMREGGDIRYQEGEDIDFDETIDMLISQKKKAEQQKVVAKANAEKAKQDAITALEQGKARVASAKADEEVEKIKRKNLDSFYKDNKIENGSGLEKYLLLLYSH